MARITMATLAARIEALEAENATLKASAAPSEASAHYTARDIVCPLRPACGKTFRTLKGLEWHKANVKHGK